MTSASAIAGIGSNGLKWRYKIDGVRVRVENIRNLIEDVNQENAKEKALLVAEQLRFIEKSIEKFFQSTAELKQTYIIEATMAENDMMDFFGRETPTYEFENDDVEGFVENFDYFLNELYDIADFERAIVN